MAEQIAPFSITAPGFFGLNTQDSPVDMNNQFALEANNCVIDRSGRVASRKGWTPHHVTNADLGTETVDCIGELVDTSGTITLLAAGNNKLFKWVDGVSDTLLTLTYGGGGVAPTITASNWQFCFFNGVAMFWQIGHDPLIYEPAISTTTYRRLSERSGSSGTIYQCNTAIVSYGRVWAASTTSDKQTVVFSDLLAPHIWTGGTSGSLDVSKVWPNGTDEIVAIAAHNNFLFIFGRHQILIYSGADTPSTMVLSDSLNNVGCVGRDTVQATGDDLVFLSNSGVRSIMRTIQEKSAPMNTVSRNVNDDIIDYINANTNTANIISVYSQTDSFYLLTFKDASRTYCFDLRSQLQDGSNRVTTWSGIAPKSYLYSTVSRVLYLGVAGYLATHSGYLDNASQYRISYFTSWLDFGDPIRTSILKRIIFTLFGASNQAVVFKWSFDYGNKSDSYTGTVNELNVSEYGTAQYGISEYSNNLIVAILSAPASGSGRVLQVGAEAQVAGLPISIQRVDIYTKEGRL